MKNFRFLLFVLPALMFASCNKNSENPSAKNKLAVPEARVDKQATTSTSITFIWDAVSGAAGYHCIFDEGQQQFTTETSMTYSDLEAGSAHTFRIRATAPENSETKDSDWSSDISISTTVEPIAEKAFTVHVDAGKITFYDAYVDITPVDDKIYYYVSYVDKDILDYMDSDAAYTTEVIASIKTLAELSGKTFGDMFIALRQQGKGTYQLRNLKPDYEYYAYAFGFNENGDVTHPMVKELFKTKIDPGIQMSDMTFKISVPENKGTSATVNVIPSKDDEWYFFAATHINNIPGETDDAVLAYYTDLFNEYLADMSFEEFAAQNLSKGADSYKYNSLNAGEQYRVFSFGLTMHGDKICPTTKLSHIDFTASEDAAPSDEKIVIATSDISSTHITATFIPQAGVQYFCDVKEYSKFKDMSDEQIINKYLEDNMYELDYIIQNSTFEISNHTPYTPDTEYIAYAFGVDADKKANTPLYKVIVKTLP